jgi:hypothetical protein
MNEPVHNDRSVLNVHLLLHVLVCGIAVGATLNLLRPLMGYPLTVTLVFWCTALLLYPAVSLWSRSQGRPRPPRALARWVIQFTATAVVIFVITYFGYR